MAAESSVAETLYDVSPDAQLDAKRRELKKLERRDWWLWVVAIVVMLLLTTAVLSMNFPGLIAIEDPLFHEGLDRAVRGLIGLVIVFNFYSVYQQRMIKRTRRELLQQIVHAEQYFKEATTDPLTGLANRRVADAHLNREMARARRRKSPVTVVAFDLDNFKQINDRYG